MVANTGFFGGQAPIYFISRWSAGTLTFLSTSTCRSCTLRAAIFTQVEGTPGLTLSKLKPRVQCCRLEAIWSQWPKRMELLDIDFSKLSVSHCTISMKLHMILTRRYELSQQGGCPFCLVFYQSRRLQLCAQPQHATPLPPRIASKVFAPNPLMPPSCSQLSTIACPEPPSAASH